MDIGEPRGLLNHVTGSGTLNVTVVSPSSEPKNSFFLNRCGAKFCQTCGTAVMRGLLAQTEMSESLSSDLVSVLALGDVVPLGRSGLSPDVAIRRMHTNWAHASVPDMQRMLMAARAPQPILDALKRFLCAQCDAMTARQTCRKYHRRCTRRVQK